MHLTTIDDHPFPEVFSWFGFHDTAINWFYSNIFSYVSGLWAHLMSFTNYWSFSLSLCFSHFIDPSSAITSSYMISAFSCMMFQNWIIVPVPPASLSSPPHRPLHQTHLSRCWGTFLPGCRKTTLNFRYLRLKQTINPASGTHTHTQRKVFLLLHSLTDGTTILSMSHL